MSQPPFAILKKENSDKICCTWDLSASFSIWQRYLNKVYFENPKSPNFPAFPFTPIVELNQIKPYNLCSHHKVPWMDFCQAFGEKSILRRTCPLLSAFLLVLNKSYLCRICPVLSSVLHLNQSYLHTWGMSGVQPGSYKKFDIQVEKLY